MKNSSFFIILFSIHQVFAQVPQFDKLEQYYDQTHYKLVYRKSKALLDNPEFDYSSVPLYYKTISSLQLIQNDRWRVKHEKSFDEALEVFTQLNKTAKGRTLLINHQQELSALKSDLKAWVADLNRRKEKELSYYFDNQITALFQGIQSEPTDNTYTWLGLDSELLKERVSIITYANQFVGVPYVWAGESPDGFDCSGFTSFVFINKEIVLPRRAKDQYEATNKVSAEKAQIGDLVFFSNGGEISHVGILVSEAGKEKVMIHASSSKGITFDKIDGSSYWEKRLYGFGSIIK